LGNPVYYTGKEFPAPLTDYVFCASLARVSAAACLGVPWMTTLA